MAGMKRVPVDSEAISSVGYDAATETLEVEFITGRIYHYHGVSPGMHRSFLTAQSLGVFFNHHIRDAYRFREVGLAGRSGQA